MKYQIACFKHLKANCNCTSPKKIYFGYRIRIPKKDKRNKWKKFAIWLLDNFNEYTINELNKHNMLRDLNIKHEKYLENK